MMVILKIWVVIGTTRSLGWYLGGKWWHEASVDLGLSPMRIMISFSSYHTYYGCECISTQAHIVQRSSSDIVVYHSNMEVIT